MKNKLFDLFFTIKPVGKGTGFELAISYEIINEKHGGKLWCESQLGGGTKFAIALPVQLASVSSLKNPIGDRHLINC